MASLTETAYYTRKAVTYGVIILVAGIVLKIVLSAFGSYWKAAHPPPPPPPTAAFGKLPILTFSALRPIPNIASPSAYSYKVETVEGKTVSLLKTGIVYFMPAIPSNLKALDRAKEKAVKLGFTIDPVQLTPEIYIWTDSENKWRNLTMNIYTGNFTIAYNFLADQTLIIDKNVPNLQNAFVEARNFLERMEIDTSELETVDKLNFQSDPRIGGYYKFSLSTLTPATSQADSDAVKINLPKKRLDDLPFASIDPYSSNISFTFSGQKDPKKQIIQATYTNFPIEKSVLATYPLKSFDEALTSLKNGDGFITSNESQENEITIRKAYLSYFDPPVPLTYLQPIIVLEGDNSFVAYIQAVSDSWITKEE